MLKKLGGFFRSWLLTEQWDCEGGRRDDLSEEEEEHSEREQDGDGEGDLLARVGGQVEDQHREEGDAHTRDDQIHGVEQSFTSQLQSEYNVGIGLLD